MPYTNARLKKYPQKAVIQVASQDIFPVDEAEPRGYSVPSMGRAKDPERSLAESKRRATAKVRDIALCNNFEFMFTWTLNPELIDRYDANIIHKKVRAFLSNAVQRKGFAYVAVPELHDLDKCGRRAIHLHGLCKLGTVKIERAISPKGKPLTDKAGRPIYNMLDWKSMRCKNMAVAGIAVYRGELVHFFLRQDAQRYMTVAQAVHFPQIVNGLMFQYQLAITVKLARPAKAGDSSHLLTPFRRGMVVVLSLSANRAK